MPNDSGVRIADGWYAQELDWNGRKQRTGVLFNKKKEVFKLEDPKDEKSARTLITMDEARVILKATVLSNIDRRENIRDGERPDFDDIHLNAANPEMVGHFQCTDEQKAAGVVERDMYGVLDVDIRPFDMVMVAVNADAAGCIWPNDAPEGACEECWAYVLAVDPQPPRSAVVEALIARQNENVSPEDLKMLTILPVRKSKAIPAWLAQEPYIVWRKRVFQHARSPVAPA